jgi:hypothetical protein
MDSHHKRKNIKINGVLVIVVFLATAWSIRWMTQQAINNYNQCYREAYDSTQQVIKDTTNAGYSRRDAVIGTFDNYSDKVNYCTKQRPPDWLILLTGVSSR